MGNSSSLMGLVYIGPKETSMRHISFPLKPVFLILLQKYVLLTLQRDVFVMRCIIWYYLYNLKNLKKNHGGVLLLVKLQAKNLQLS